MIKRALKHLLSKEKYAELVEESEYLYIKDSQDDVCHDRSGNVEDMRDQEEKHNVFESS